MLETRSFPGRTLMVALLAVLGSCGRSSDEQSLVGSGVPKTSKSDAPAESGSGTPNASLAPRVSVRGASMEVPPDFVELEPERIERLRQAALGMDPTSTVTIDAKRGKTMMEGVGYVQRSQTKLSGVQKHGRLREVYAREMASLELMWIMAGLQIRSFESKVAPSGASACSVTIQTQRGESVELFTCMQETITREGIAIVGANCLQAVGASLCAKMMETRVLDTGPGLGLEEVMGPPIEPLELGAFALGHSRDAFAAACKKHGLKPLRPEKEPGAMGAALASGKLVGCAGSDPKFAWGGLERVTGDIVEDRVAGLLFDVQRPAGENDRKLVSTYGDDVLVDKLDSKRFLWPDAKGFDPLGVRAGPPSTGKPEGSALYVFSRALFDAVNPRPKP